MGALFVTKSYQRLEMEKVGIEKPQPQQHLSMYPLILGLFVCVRTQHEACYLKELAEDLFCLVVWLPHPLCTSNWTSWRSDVHRFLDVVSGHCLSMLGQCYYFTCELGIILLIDGRKNLQVLIGNLSHYSICRVFYNPGGAGLRPSTVWNN